MLDYRAFLLDQGDRIIGAHEFWAKHDADALAQTQRIEHPGGLELWQRARRIAVLNAASLAAGGGH